MEAWVSLLIGVVVLSGSVFMASRPRQIAEIIHEYYSNLAERKRRWPRWLAWQLNPNSRQPLVMAWILIGVAFFIGTSGIVAWIASR